ncbi:MAG: MiaB/RimO family radical SAM methylthiotransferase [Candidatus Omnitrophota bacterium]
MKRSFTIISLGCPRNLVDSECIISEFRKKGYLFRDNATGVDTVIINTCAFIEDAKKESIDAILKVIDAKKNGAVKNIIVAGCLSERYPKELRRDIKGIDGLRGVLDFKATFTNPAVRLTPPHYGYIKISEGCGNRCTYCIIPRLKGPYRTRPIESIIKEAEHLVQRGIKEIVLVGQDTSLYGIDLYGKKRLAGLLERLQRISDKIWIRLLYLHPGNLDKDVIKTIRDMKSICRYIDLPIEHITESILKRMGRKTKTRDIYALIKYIRKTIPGVAIRSSFIVGFPGERDKDFRALLSFIRDTRFERVGVFRYSREEGTPAYSIKPQISEKDKERRFQEVMSVQQGIAKEVNEKFRGEILKVLVEEKKESSYYIGRSEYDAPDVDGLVYVKGEGLEIGNFYNVRITDTYEYDLVGQHVRGFASNRERVNSESCK